MSRKRKRAKELAAQETAAPSRKTALAAAVVVLVAAAGIALTYRAADRSGPGVVHRLAGHNVLLVTIDTLRADRLGAYGSTAGLTPRLDRLAEKGIVFENVLAHAPVTLPSHSSIFTAKYPTGHGVHDNGTFRLDEAHVTLAETLKDAGYDTAAFVGAFVLDARFGLAQGFDLYDDYYGEKRAFASFTELERRADAVVGPAQAWLEQRTERPWFAWVHLFDPHAPYDAPEPFGSRYRDAPYDGEVAYTDHVLTSFLDRLESRGLLERTLVVVTGDHGESLGEHGERTHGVFAYNATLRVPLIFWAKDLEPRRISDWVRSVDVTPTIVDLLDLPALRDVDGAPLLAADADLPKQTYFEALNAHLTRDWAPLRGVVRENVKFIDLPVPEIYDLESDPDETVNLASQRAGLARELRDLLEEITAGQDEIIAGETDEDTRRRLAALGYVVAPSGAGRRSEYTEADDPKRLVSLIDAHDDAADLFVRGETEEALRLFRELVERQPRSSFAYQKLAYALRQSGRTDEAVRVLESALENGVTDLSLQALLGSYLMELGDLDNLNRARGLLEISVSEHPDFAEGHNYLGVTYARLGRPNDARRSLQTVLRLDPSSATAHNNLGSLELGVGNVEGAIREFERALELDAGLASANNGLGVARARSGDRTAAVQAWKRAVELDPAQFDALFNLAMVLTEIDPAEARPYLERFADTAPKARYGKDIELVRSMLSQGS